jgi:DNA-binding NtrC family response regulator
MAFYFGAAPAMKDLERRAALIAQSGDPILIQGESGSGKQALAERLHALGAYSGRFVQIVCGVAGNGRLSHHTAADSVFLKRVHLLSAAGQERLLLTLEQMTAESPRILASASGSLEQQVMRGEFLPELFYRISVHRIYLPPLRERAADIPELFACMLQEMQAGSGRAARPPQALREALQRYPWPGNARELQNMARAYLLTGNAGELICELARRGQSSELRREEPDMALREQVRRASRRLESEIILRSLERHHWNRRRTAETLKISYRSLLYKMKDCNIGANGKAVPKGER